LDSESVFRVLCEYESRLNKAISLAQENDLSGALEEALHKCQKAFYNFKAGSVELDQNRMLSPLARDKIEEISHKYDVLIHALEDYKTKLSKTLENIGRDKKILRTYQRNKETSRFNVPT
jgi:hypothetical protein